MLVARRITGAHVGSTRASLAFRSHSMDSLKPQIDDNDPSKSGVVNINEITFKSSFMKALAERGYLYQCTDPWGVDRAMSNERVSAYIGFDATAKSLHVGSLVQLMILRLLQKCGHRPIILIGGGTTKVGDPSGKDKSRQLLSTSDIEANISSIAKVFRNFIDFSPSNPNPALLLNNAHWLNGLNYIDFLRTHGQHFSVNRMLGFDSVKTRLAREEPLSFLEFNYMILQAYDFKYINENYGATLQIGGSDQWGNMVCGIDLARKSKQVSLQGLTAPLITMSDGKKMGKSEAGAIWLDSEMLSAFDYWQFWRNTADTDVARFFKLFTELSMDRIAELTKGGGSTLNAAKIVLADEATALIHGTECLAGIHKSINSLYASSSVETKNLVLEGDGDQSDDPMDHLPLVTFEDRSIIIAIGEGAERKMGVDLAVALVLCRLATTRSESRRLIKGGGVKVNDEKIEDEFFLLEKNCFTNKGRTKLSVGKKRHVAFIVSENVWAAAVSPKISSANRSALVIESAAKVKSKPKSKAVAIKIKKSNTAKAGSDEDDCEEIQKSKKTSSDKK